MHKVNYRQVIVTMSFGDQITLLFNFFSCIMKGHWQHFDYLKETEIELLLFFSNIYFQEFNTLDNNQIKPN